MIKTLCKVVFRRSKATNEEQMQPSVSTLEFFQTLYVITTAKRHYQESILNDHARKNAAFTNYNRNRIASAKSFIFSMWFDFPRLAINVQVSTFQERIYMQTCQKISFIMICITVGFSIL